VIEGALYALSQAVFFAGGSRLVNWDPLVAKLGQLDLVDYALPMLTDTEDPKYRAAIAQFVDDPRDRVRESAREALAQHRGRVSRLRRRARRGAGTGASEGQRPALCFHNPPMARIAMSVCTD
jgi:hypothetical protein